MSKQAQTQIWPKLPASFKRRWLKALRSGEYRGRRGELCAVKVDGKTPKGFCCLGVAGHIQGIPVSVLNGETFLDKSVTAHAKRIIPEPLRGANDLTGKLANMNDNKYGFKRIADWIEKNL